jgi:hypothetical protein
MVLCYCSEFRGMGKEYGAKEERVKRYEMDKEKEEKV